MTPSYSDTGERITPIFAFPSPRGEVEAVRVDYAPGGHTPGPHWHPAGAYVYVLNGAVRIGLNDQEPEILRAGDVLHERPEDAHTMSANASTSEPASLIAFFALEPDQAATVLDKPE